MKTKQGFTLIELLVVVLIIGILAAVALPQYLHAVRKSRMTQAMAVLNAMGKAEEVYFLANGEYTTNMDDLDMGVGSQQFNNKWGTVYLDTNGAEPHLEVYTSFMPAYVYLVYQLSKSKLYCSAYGTEANAECKRLYGETEVIVDPSNSNYTMYLVSQ